MMTAEFFLEDIAEETGLGRNATPFNDAQVLEELERHYSLHGRVIRLPTEKDDTFRLEVPLAEGGHQNFLVKVSQPTEDPEIVDLQSSALVHLEQMHPGLPVQRLLPTNTGAKEVLLENAEGPFPRVLRVISFIPGRLLAEVEGTVGLPQFEETGEMLARITQGLENFSHPREERNLLWDLKHFHKLQALLPYVDDSGHRSIVETIMDQFEDDVVPQLGSLSSQVVHGDFSPYNVVVSPSGSTFITGVIDFGDVVRTPRIFDVAVALANQIGKDAKSPWSKAAALVSGYTRYQVLTGEERQLLRISALARLALRPMVAQWRACYSPDRYDYLMSHASKDWQHLTQAMRSDQQKVEEFLTSISSPLSKVSQEGEL